MALHPLLLLGAGGHAKVVHALAVAAGYNVIGVCDPQLSAQDVNVWRGVPVLGGDDAMRNVDPQKVGLLNGIGKVIGSEVRREVFKRYVGAGFLFPVIKHPTAWIAPCVKLGAGAQIMAGVILQPDAEIGSNSIINTHASVDHDCRIGEHVHIAPGAVLCGGVRVGDDAFVGSGATVIQGLSIGESSVVAAGATLVRSLPSFQTFLPHRGATIKNE